ncbi:MAG: hypothetical protein HY927_14600 [Elusimicrobia bacterium]|nr:hypothetical protein [Elusimicrobiota bacterium]
MMRRYRKGIAVALLLLNFSGARVVTVSAACERSRSYFGPARGFKAIVKKALHQQRRDRAQRSLGASKRRSSRDIEATTRSNAPAPVVVQRDAETAVSPALSPINPLYSWKLPQDRSPVQPPHLSSKK